MTANIVFFVYKNASLRDRANRFTCILSKKEFAASRVFYTADKSVYLCPIHIYTENTKIEGFLPYL
jgi:hypothetical protein